jgi:pimeloyl-ACP methyl ester carboxylesterase
MNCREERGRLDAAGFAIEYLRLTPFQANDDMPVLVLLHQGLGCVEMWRDFPRRLCTATGLPVLVYSRRGHGGSDSYELPWSARYMHDEALEMLPAVLAAAGIERHLIYGHSDGASIAVVHAGTRPRGLEGIVLAAPHVFVEAVNLAKITEMRARYHSEGVRDRLARYHGANVDNAFFGWADAWLSDDFADWDLSEYLPAITVPVLIIQGEDDAYGTAAQCQRIADGVDADVANLMLSECGHSPHHEQTERVVAAVAGFVSNVKRPASLLAHGP